MSRSKRSLMNLIKIKHMFKTKNLELMNVAEKIRFDFS